MRVALVSLIALTAAASQVAVAQTPQTMAPQTPAPATPTSATPAPAPQAAPAPAPQTTPAPMPAATTTTQPTADATAPAPPPPAPPAPPPPPTDPTAIELLTILKSVCIPAANGGNLATLAKAAGLKKAGDQGYNLKTHDYTLLVENPGSNPTQCHVDLTHPADAESPGRPIIIALNDWAGIINGWSLYRNDKSVQEGLQFTTRSWQLDWNGQEQSLVFTTKRKPDGTPLKPNTDTSEMIYGVVKTG